MVADHIMTDDNVCRVEGMIQTNRLSPVKQISKEINVSIGSLSTGHSAKEIEKQQLSYANKANENI